ncbi:MAG TPA: serpin family protein, partial [Candidatus Limnocylindrales bacterium]
MRRLPVFILVAGLVVGCSSAPASSPAASLAPGSTPSPASVSGITLAEAHVTRLAASDAEAKSAGSAVNAFGLALYAKARTGSGNIVLSPASIAIAVAMARAGARGTTASEMDTVLRDLATDAHAGWVASLDQALNARTGTYQDPTGKPRDVTLRVVNAPFAQRGMALVPAYLDALSARFGAGLRLVDYKTDPE